jgi:hypothetical protein
MRRNQQVSLWLSISILGALTLSPALLGQASPGSKAAAPAITDWSYHHVIFSKPATAEQARRVEQDPRYWQQIRRQSPAVPEADTRRVLASELRGRRRHGSSSSENPGLDQDWSQDLGAGATVGAGNYPAKYSLNTTVANCATDFVVYGTGLSGTGGHASIVAYDNLYSGCGGTVPLVRWAYNTGGGQILTSPVFSRDGTQLAFAQTSAGAGSLVLVKWAASGGTITAPVSLASVSPGLYAACAVLPCMTTLALTDASSAANDTSSSVFYDYTPASDTAYVGDNSGYLHKFNPVFNGTTLNPPSEVTTGGWPVKVNSSASTALTSPVYDSVSGNVFVADKGGFLYRVNSSTAAVTVSGHLDVSNQFDAGPGIVQGPVVDSTAELVYVFATSDGKGDCAGGLDCSVVYAASTAFTAGETPPHAIVGASTAHGTAPAPLYIGAFDSTYVDSVNATGNLYVCGNTGGEPTLYQVPLAAGVFGTVNAVTALSTATTPCSPVTHIVNANASPPAELVFASVHAGGTSAAFCPAAGGCIYNSKVAPWQPNTTYAVGQEILDTNFQIQVVETAVGNSSAVVPIWSTTVGGNTTDHGVTWLNQGPVSATIVSPGWTKGTTYGVGDVIVDSNGNIELVTAETGKTAGTAPPWLTAPGATTLELNGKVTYENLGPNGTAALAAAGGTSGIIIDNTVATGTEAGASQIYFSTLGTQACTGGSGGCAVQASQSALK